MEYSDNKTKLISIDIEHQRERYLYRFCKRLFDFLASLVGLMVLSPVFLIVAISIKIEDPRGPVFYSADCKI